MVTVVVESRGLESHENRLIQSHPSDVGRVNVGGLESTGSWRWSVGRRFGEALVAAVGRVNVGGSEILSKPSDRPNPSGSRSLQTLTAFVPQCGRDPLCSGRTSTAANQYNHLKLATAVVYRYKLEEAGNYVGFAIGSARPVPKWFIAAYADNMTAEEMDELTALSSVMGDRLWDTGGGHLTHGLASHQPPTVLFSEAFAKLRNQGFPESGFVLTITSSIEILYTVTQRPDETVKQMRGGLICSRSRLALPPPRRTYHMIVPMIVPHAPSNIAPPV